VSVKDPKGNLTSYVYNGFGDAIQQTSPDAGTTIYFYDPDSNLTGKNEAGINFSSADPTTRLDRILTPDLSGGFDPECRLHLRSGGPRQGASGG